MLRLRPGAPRRWRRVVAQARLLAPTGGPSPLLRRCQRRLEERRPCTRAAALRTATLWAPLRLPSRPMAVWLPRSRSERPGPHLAPSQVTLGPQVAALTRHLRVHNRRTAATTTIAVAKPRRDLWHSGRDYHQFVMASHAWSVRGMARVECPRCSASRVVRARGMCVCACVRVCVCVKPGCCVGSKEHARAVFS